MMLDLFAARYQYQSVNSLHLKKIISLVGLSRTWSEYAYP